MDSHQFLQGHTDESGLRTIGESDFTHENDDSSDLFPSTWCTGSYLADQNIINHEIGSDPLFTTTGNSYEATGGAETTSSHANREPSSFEPSWLYNEQINTTQQLTGQEMSRDLSITPDLTFPNPSVPNEGFRGELGSPRPTSNPRWPNSQLILDQSHRRQELPRRRSIYKIRNTDRGASHAFMPPHANPAHPFERWKETPPEGEASSLSEIRNALLNPTLYSTRNEGQQDNTSSYSTSSPGVAEQYRNQRAPTSRPASTTSVETSISASSRRSENSGVSSNSRTQHKSTAGVKRNKASGGKKKRTSATAPAIFCCTFCCDKFKSKYDWIRHEKSLHLNIESWVCAPNGGCVVLPSTGRVHCAYCNQLDPSTDHLEKHNYSACRRHNSSFKRKDHLVQHLRLAHQLETMPLIDEWKRVVTDIPSRCGFCSGRMSTWDERANHLTFHFREGRNMAHWKGDHDFPPEIAAQITHSVPPYMLDFESRTFVPFSATNRAVNDHLSQMISRATFSEAEDNQEHVLPEATETSPQIIQEPGPQLESYAEVESYTEVLTRHLSHYAQKNMRQGIVPSDEMFQMEARRLLFDSEDSWDQTLADSPEWLAKFRIDRYKGGLPHDPR